MDSSDYEELDDVLYGEHQLEATVIAVDKDSKGKVVKYFIELHEGYTSSFDKVRYADPNELVRHNM